jgi:hypothetical protein
MKTKTIEHKVRFRATPPARRATLQDADDRRFHDGQGHRKGDEALKELIEGPQRQLELPGRCPRDLSEAPVLLPAHGCFQLQTA